jgi:hypothetical protein
MASTAVTPASVGSHHAGDIVGAVTSYNLGVQNDEVTSKNWEKPTGKADRILWDIEAMFASRHGIQVVLLSEFGNMYACVDDKWKKAKPAGSTLSFFQDIVKKMNNEDIVVHALPPYVALVDSSVWEVQFCEKLSELCDYKANFAMHLLLRHKASGVLLRALNCHIPSSHGTQQRKKDTINNLGKVCTQKYFNGGHQRWKNYETSHWIIAGDLNVDESILKQYCQPFVEPHVPCVSTSGRDMTDARKADIAISQGIDLCRIPAWVGHCEELHASDCHNMVAVIGVLKPTSSGSHSAGIAEVSQARVGARAPDETIADTLPDVVAEAVIISNVTAMSTTPPRAQGYHCPSCFKCWKVGEEMPHGGLCTCPAQSELQEVD